jgi:cell division septal protein FtsQ
MPARSRHLDARRPLSGRALATPAQPARHAGSWRARLISAAALLTVVALAYGGWRLYNSSLFIVRAADIVVHGALEVSSDDVREAAGLAGQRYFSLDADAAAARVRALPWVRNANVQRRFPHAATITVSERRPIGIWQVGAVDYVVADDGVVVDTVPPDDSLPLVDASRAGVAVQIGGRVDPDALLTAKRIGDELPARIGQSAVRFSYERETGLTVITDKGVQVRVGDGKDLDYKLGVWAAVVAKVGANDLHELDLRFGDRPYYR